MMTPGGTSGPHAAMHAWSAVQSSSWTKHATVSAQQPACMQVSHAGVGNVTPLACMLHTPPDWGVPPPVPLGSGLLAFDDEHAAAAEKAKNTTATGTTPARKLLITRS
jgi:hypothetical protein